MEDSVVFVDDNPAECQLVQESFPQMTGKEQQAEFGDYTDYLKSLAISCQIMQINKQLGVKFAMNEAAQLLNVGMMADGILKKLDENK